MGWRSMFRRSRRKLPEPPPNEDSELERFFTDAEEARARFRELLDSRPLAKRIVVVHGVGAVGKSSLLRMFRLYCRRSQVPVALVGAEDAPSVVAVLERWGSDLRGSGVDLPTFEDTLRRYREVQSRVDAEAAKAGEAQADAATKLGTAAAKGAIKLAASTITTQEMRYATFMLDSPSVGC